MNDKSAGPREPRSRPDLRTLASKARKVAGIPVRVGIVTVRAGFAALVQELKDLRA